MSWYLTRSYVHHHQSVGERPVRHVHRKARNMGVLSAASLQTTSSGEAASGGATPLI